MSFFKPIENIYIHGDGEGCDEWILTPERESANIDVSKFTISVYRDLMCIDSASKNLLCVYDSYKSYIGSKK